MTTHNSSPETNKVINARRDRRVARKALKDMNRKHDALKVRYTAANRARLAAEGRVKQLMEDNEALGDELDHARNSEAATYSDLSATKHKLIATQVWAYSATVAALGTLGALVL